MLDVSNRKKLTQLAFNDFIDELVDLSKEITPKSESYSIVRDSDSHLKNLEKAYESLNRFDEKKKIASSGVEWYLDNYYVVLKAIELIRDDLPEVYFKKLPSIKDDPQFPRIYHIAHAILAYYQVELVQNDINEFLTAFQKHISLEMSELWALPLMLRLVLVEILSGTVFHLVEDEKSVSETIIIDENDLSADEIIARALRTLILFDRIDWKKFFESHAQVEKILQKDPLGIYQSMDFDTRDLYRKKIEFLAEHSNLDEKKIAQFAIDLADRPEQPSERTRHVGFYLLDDGAQELQEKIDFKPDLSGRLRQFFFENNTAFYLGSILLLTALVILALILITRSYVTDAWRWALIGFVSIIPASSVAVNLLNSILTTTLPPKTLPKMDFSKYIPNQFRSIVVIPALLTSCEELEFLLKQLELHYLSNKDKNICFVLLTDFGDSSEENTPEDQECFDAAIAGINALNETYHGDDGRRPFYLFHRLRQWNPKEDVWMGWERKRGKLADFNRFLIEGFLDSFDTIIGDLDFMKRVRYVITLDSDTVLPRDSAKALIATMAHPLNQPEFDEGSSKVVRGYTILQPRTEVKPTSVIKSFFTRVYAGDLGLDLYTRAVSDVYQDLFGEGIYVGKGIYDVAAFHRCLDKKVPQNSMLSHDLFEGIQSRAGLVSDIIFYEDYPPDYASQVNRLHRWVRGDWQLLPWLFPRVPTDGDEKAPNPFTTIDLWKIIDNLRRSLLAPTMLLSLVIGLMLYQENSWIWTLLILLVSAFPLFNNIVSSLSSRFLKGAKANVFSNIRIAFLRWLLWLIFLPYESLIMIDAIMTTLVRIFISRKRLLQWQTSAHTIRVFGRHRKISAIWTRMIGAPLISIAIGLLVFFIQPTALLTSLPLILVWIFSPQVAYWISRRREYKKGEALSEDELRELRAIARWTWLYFERFIGPEDHWLPPDHFQEDPKGSVAHRTSPTNIGLMLLSTAVAYDFGYIGVFDFVYRMTYSFETLDKMEKYRGHLLNWYDTRSLETLSPRYVSTVDSGNYATSLVGLYQTIKELPEHSICPSALFRGASDSMGVLSHIVSGITSEALAVEVQSLYDHCLSIQKDLLQPNLDDTQQIYLLSEVREQLLLEMQTLINQISESEEAIHADIIQDLRYWSESIFNHLENTQKQIKILAPWLDTWKERPAFLDELESELLTDALQPWHQNRTLQTALSEIPALADRTIQSLKVYGEQNNDPQLETLTKEQTEMLIRWLRQLIQDLRQAKANVTELFDQINNLAHSIEFHLERIEFTFLYDEQREVFYLGYELESGRMDQNHYDLLASEARTASLFAIAQNQVPRSHWLHLARPFTSISGTPTLVSWNGSMFEYLMPNLFTHTYPETLLDETSKGVVQAQIDYGKQNKVPWGISESSYYMFDQAENYQYKGFGVPSLGRKRGLANDLVISPYASLLAINVKPRAVLENIEALKNEGALGHFGFYESIDYTKSRLPLGQDKAIIKSYMAHHQGMIMVAFGNFLNTCRVIDRVHSDPRIITTELLLQEQIPQAEMVQTTKDQTVSVGAQDATGITVTPWSPNSDQPGRAVHTLSNGRLNLLMTDSGSGYLSWKDIALTRWRQDEALDPWGIWFYIQDLDQGNVWSIGMRPVGGQPQEYQVIYSPHMTEIRQVINQTWMTMQTTIMPNEDVCLQKITITNQSKQKRHYRVLSYGEVVLAPQAMDQQHPAFNKLFIESDFDAELNSLHFTRRLRSSTEEPRAMSHFLFDGISGKPEFTADRRQFVGRGRNLSNPVVIIDQEELNGGVGTTLDPIFSIGKRFTLNPNRSVTLTYLTIAAETTDTVKSIAETMLNETRIENAFTSSESHNIKLMRTLNLDSGKLSQIQSLLSHVVYPVPRLRADSDTLAKNELGQSGLWPFGISGDYPILLVLVNKKEEAEDLQDILLAHHYWRKMGLMIDLVIMNTKDAGYTQELNEKIHQVINIMERQVWLNQRGGIFTLTASQMDIKPLRLLKTAANVLLDLNNGSLETFLEKAKAFDPHLPAFGPTYPEQEYIVEEKIDRPHSLMLDNGIGGFTTDGREYQIFLENYPKLTHEPGQITPAPWANVIANPEFGFLVTESGGGYTWSMNSGENRLTPWTNDPLSDSSGESLYLRDEINGKIWSPTPFPAGAGINYLVKHGQGYSIFESINHGFHQQLKVFVDSDDPVKIIELNLKNLTQEQRRITATYYAEWVLGANRESSKKFIIPSFENESSSLMARNSYSAEFSDRVAFLTSDRPAHGITTDRHEFLGSLGSRDEPEALCRVGLSGKVEPGFDPCAALQVHLNFNPGEELKLIFALGQGVDEAAARELALTYSQPEKTEDSFNNLTDRWDQLLGSTQVETPSSEMNLVLNRWLLYQTLSSRIWGRTGFYQSSGAYGFRDQLQDVLAMLTVDPDTSREHILRAAKHQFDAGDVLHWWHPPSGRGVRTRITDDLLWLVYVTAEYVQVTGDRSILNEEVPFKLGESLEEGEEERYSNFETSQETATIFEHCRRALERGDTEGPHGLPLIGGGDWNDGMNRVGIEGKGESVWLAWFLCENHQRFAELCLINEDASLAEVHRQRAAQLVDTINQQGWDGHWYRRAYYDDGEPLGSKQSKECKIDSLPQSWSVLTQGAPNERQTDAMQAVVDHLVQNDHRIIQLFTPPFDQTKHDPGYIKGYPPGIRENGGQYTHAAVWAAWAFAALGRGDQAFEYFSYLNPISHSLDISAANQYRVEPYVVAADVYSTAPFTGQGGWTWYTGSASWLYRFGIEGILGFKRRGDHIIFDPCIPSTWDGFTFTYSYQESTYIIEVKNPGHVQSGVKQVLLDGSPVEGQKIPLRNDQHEYTVEVILG
jgi:cyclic beta-1,2-glucan synthetase